MHKKIKANAIAAYLFMAPMFLLPSKNDFIKNEFVQSHSKTALTIQIALIFSFILFIPFGFLNDIQIFEMGLNHILAKTTAIALFGLLILWIKKASEEKTFSLVEFKDVRKIKSEITKENLNEKDKLFQTLSYIPFIWILLWNKSEIYLFPSKVSSIAWLISVLLLATWKVNSLDVFLLFYLILVVFVWVLNFTSNESSIIRSNIPDAKELLTIIRTTLKYIFSIPFNKDFVTFRDTMFGVLENTKKEKEEKENIVGSLPDSKIPSFLCYIPLVNLVTIPFFKTKIKYHVLNWLFVNAFILIIALLPINNSVIYFALFPIFYWLSNREESYYKLPFLWDFADIFINLFKIFTKTKEKVKEKQAEQHTFSGKV